MRILGYNYTVYTQGHARMGAFGELRQGKQEIVIAAGLPPQQTTSTVLHEIIEALNYHLALDLGHGTIMALEAGLYQVRTENGVDLGVLAGHINAGLCGGGKQ